MKQIFSKKYGVTLCRFSHDKNAVFYASANGWDHTIRYLNVRTNAYLRYFKGHTAKVTSLALCPSSDLFLSASQDGTARLWDLNSSACKVGDERWFSGASRFPYPRPTLLVIGVAGHVYAELGV